MTKASPARNQRRKQRKIIDLEKHKFEKRQRMNQAAADRIRVAALQMYESGVSLEVFKNKATTAAIKALGEKPSKEEIENAIANTHAVLELLWEEFESDQPQV